MFAIFKKEVSLYFLTPFGYIFIGFFLIVSSIVFVVYNLFGARADLYGMFSMLNIVSIVIFPVLTMKLFADEKRNSTIQLLMTSPITISSIIIGKYLAAIFIFLITLFLTLIFAFFVLINGHISVGSVMGSYLSFFILGSAYIAICLFASSISGNQVISVIMGLGILLGFILIGFLSNIFSSPLMKEIINWFSIINRYDELSQGVLKIGPLFYYISYIIFFIILSIYLSEYQLEKSSNNSFFFHLKSIGSRNNDLRNKLNILINILLIFGVLAISNLIFDQLPWTYDMTVDQLFTLSEKTQRVLSELEKPVNIIVFTEDKNKDRMIHILLEEYKKVGKGKIYIEYIDAERNPIAAKKYEHKNVGISNGNIIIECEGKVKRIHQFEIVKQSNMGLGKSFEGEHQFTGGILYVTSENFNKIYFLEGHQEMSIDNELYSLKNRLSNEAHISVSLNLLNTNYLPEVDILVVAAPKRDLDDDEYSILSHYLETGGRAVFLFDVLGIDVESTMINFNNIMGKYGISVQNNFVVEENPGKFYSNNKMYLIPDYCDNEIVEKISKDNLFLLFPYPGNIEVLNNKNEDLKIKPILISSEESWIRYDLQDASPNKNKNDLAGPALLAVSIIKDNADKKYKETKIVVIYNAKFITDSVLDVQANFDFFMNSLNWLEDKEDEMMIRPKIIDANKMNIKGSEYMIFAIISVLVIPGFVFLSGFFIWYRRKNL